ncbi:MAG: hypothetical protein D3910_26915 [Candidatus Electrothrix sp. ATG2]|nr:hypothetical protein [Candidatus Electrothrix sp. ATG2]
MQKFLDLVKDNSADQDCRIAAATVIGELGYLDKALSYLISVIQYPLSGWVATYPDPLNMLVKISQGEDEVLQLLHDIMQNEQVPNDVKNSVYTAIKQLTLKNALLAN